jgi:uncharacterized membrane protein
MYIKGSNQKKLLIRRVKNMHPSQERFKSKVVWLSVLFLVLSVLNTAGIFEKIGVTEGMAKMTVETILSILVLFGVLNNPTDKENF